MDDSTNDSLNQFLLGLGDVAINVAIPTLATAGAGSMMAASMSNVESGMATALCGGKMVMDSVAKPLIQNHLNSNDSNQTSNNTPKRPDLMDDPVLKSIKKAEVS